MKRVLFFFITLLGLKAYPQTIGIGEVISIESKANTFENNKAKIKQYTAELPELERLWKEKIQKLKTELADLYKERDNLIADMKVGARCSQCNQWKSEFEKKGINFEKHLGEVKGYAVPATTAELEAVRTRFAEKIALKKVQIQNLESGNNPVTKKQEEITNLEKINDKLCQEITGHSKAYETKVFADAKSKHQLWANSLMAYVTDILTSDDKIVIYKARAARHEKEFQEESKRVNERVAGETKEEQDRKNNKIAQNEQQIKTIFTDKETYLAPLQNRLNTLTQSKLAIEKELKQPGLPDSVKAQQQASYKQLSEQITTVEKNIADYETATTGKIAALKEENQKLTNEIFQLKVNLPKKQAQEILKIKPAYDQKIADAKQAETLAVSSLANARKAYSEKQLYHTKNNDAFISEIVSESNRMLVAGQKISCPVWNNVRGSVSGNWNQVLPCVHALTTLAKPYSTNVFNAYCNGQNSSDYMAAYKSFLAGLNDEDKAAIKGSTNVWWFDLMTK